MPYSRVDGYWEPVEPAIRVHTAAAVQALRDRGGRIVEVRTPDVTDLAGTYPAIVGGEGYATHAAWLADCRGAYQPATRASLEPFADQPAREYVDALRTCRRLAAEFWQAVRDVDVLVLPTTGLRATPIGLSVVRVDGQPVAVGHTLLAFTLPFNLTGMPVISVPLPDSGLPVGVQLVGVHLDEHGLLRVAEDLAHSFHGLAWARHPARRLPYRSHTTARTAARKPVRPWAVGHGAVDHDGALGSQLNQVYRGTILLSEASRVVRSGRPLRKEDVMIVVLCVLIAVAALCVLLAGSSIRVVKQYERGVVLRFGQLRKAVRGPGLTVLAPVADRLHRVNMQIVTMPVPAQEGITRDNVTVRVDAVVYYRVTDPVKVVVDVQNYNAAIGQVAQAALRSIIGKSDLDDLLSNRERLNEGLELMIDTPAIGWGVQIDRVEIKDVALPESMKRSMSRQAEAERERRSRVITADGELQASRTLAEAAEVMAEHPAALQLRLLQTVVEVAAEKNSTLVLPFPVELLRFLERATPDAATIGPARSVAASSGDGAPAAAEEVRTADPLTGVVRLNESLLRSTDLPSEECDPEQRPSTANAHSALTTDGRTPPLGHPPTPRPLRDDQVSTHRR